MMQKNSGCLWMLAGFAICLGLIFAVAVFVLGSASMRAVNVKDGAPKFEESILVDGKPSKDAKSSDAKIAVIYLRGVISSSEAGSVGDTMVDDLKIQLQQAAEDEKVKAVVLYVDSPGGEVTASDVIYNAVRKVRDGARKPVVVYMGSMAASGGYYVSCGGTYLMANETTLTGSIGVIMQTLNYQELFGKVGLETITFKSGQFKDMLSGARKMTPDEQAYVQKMVMDTYGKFVGIVAHERKLNEDDLRKGLADGRVISGKEARDAKLINGLGQVEDAYAKAMELGKAPGATIIRYESPFKFARIFKLLGQEEKSHVEVNIVKSLTPKLEAGRLYFLPKLLRSVALTNSHLIQALGTLISIALLAACVATYSRVILRLRRDGGNVRSDGFQISEALAAFVLASFFIGLVVLKTLSHKEAADAALTVRQVAPSSFFFIILSGGIAGFLKLLRGMKLRETFGITRLSPIKVLGWAAGLLACAFPLILLAAFLSQQALPKEDVTPQPLIELFRNAANHGDYSAVAAILIDGVLVAPICEEFLFRGFFYGVGKRFLGPVPAAFLVALLFAAVHLNLASFASLFVLALCFILAYERTGSLLVPMCMHALFNLTNLAVILAQAQGWFSTQ